MTDKERQTELLAEKLNLYGVPLSLFYILLGFLSDGVALLKSLDEQYNFIKLFGLDRIW